MLLPAIFYIIWDGYFAGKGVWFFNQKYIATPTSIYNLPVEEVLFFFVVPYCCTFIYQCIRSYFPELKPTKKADVLLGIIGFFAATIAIINYNLIYTFCTGIFLFIFIAAILIFRSYFSSLNTTAFLTAYSIILIPFLIVNGFLTKLPVITYNNTENLGIRIYTIPVEDIFYGMLLILMNVAIYEKLKSKHQ